MSHKLKRQVSTNQNPVLFHIRILKRTWRRGKSKRYNPSHHRPLFLLNNKQLKFYDMVTGQSTGFLGHPSPSKEAVSYRPRGRFEQLPASASEARTRLHLLGAALCSSSPWLMFRVNTYLPSTLPGRSPTATRPGVAGQEKWKRSFGTGQLSTPSLYFPITALKPSWKISPPHLASTCFSPTDICTASFTLEVRGRCSQRRTMANPGMTLPFEGSQETALQ